MYYFEPKERKYISGSLGISERLKKVDITYFIA
jgi:hypothetical protein